MAGQSSLYSEAVNSASPQRKSKEKQKYKDETNSSSSPSVETSSTTINAKQKRTRGPRSCSECRKAKLRCELPVNRDLIPSLTPQAIELACVRCRHLNRDCIVDFALPKYSKWYGQEERLKQGVSEKKKAKQCHKAQSEESNEATAEVFPLTTTFMSNGVDGVHSPPIERIESEHERPAHTSFAMQLLDPKPYINPRVGSMLHSRSISKAGVKPDWFDDLRATLCPLHFFGCLVQLQIPMAGPTAPQRLYLNFRALVKPFLISQTEFQACETYITGLQRILPFLPSLHDLVRTGEEGDFLLGTLTVLAFEEEFEGAEHFSALEEAVKSRACSSLLLTPSHLLDISALLVIAIYHPLLLGNGSRESSLDGSGFLSTAASAARSLNFDNALVRLRQQVQMRDYSNAPMLLQQGALWVALVMQSNLIAYSQGHHAQIVASCHSAELSVMENYCRNELQEHSIQMPKAYKEHMASLVFLILRTRAIVDARGRIKAFLSESNKPIDESIDTHDCYTRLFNITRQAGEANSRQLEKHVSHIRDWFEIFNKSGFWGLEAMYDWLEFDLAIVNFTFASFLTENTFCRLESFLPGPPMRSGMEFFYRLLNAGSRRELIEHVGFGRGHKARHILILFANLVDSLFERTADQSSIWILFAGLPAVHICSIVVACAKSVVEEVAGMFLSSRKYPSTMPIGINGGTLLEGGLLLLHKVRECLARMSQIPGPVISSQPHRGARNQMFVISRVAVENMLNTMKLWKRMSRGIEKESARSEKGGGGASGHLNLNSSDSGPLRMESKIRTESFGASDQSNEFDELLLQNILSVPVESLFPSGGASI